MADEKTFSHITVSLDDDDDFVVQAGVPKKASGRAIPAESMVSPLPQAQSTDMRPDPDSSDLKKRRASVGDNAASDGERHLPLSGSSAKQGVSVQGRDKGYRATQLDDLKATPMSLAQKIVIIVAALLVVAFFVYYFFLR